MQKRGTPEKNSQRFSILSSSRFVYTALSIMRTAAKMMPQQIIPARTSAATFFALLLRGKTFISATALSCLLPAHQHAQTLCFLNDRCALHFRYGKMVFKHALNLIWDIFFSQNLTESIHLLCIQRQALFAAICVQGLYQVMAIGIRV